MPEDAWRGLTGLEWGRVEMLAFRIDNFEPTAGFEPADIEFEVERPTGVGLALVSSALGNQHHGLGRSEVRHHGKANGEEQDRQGASQCERGSGETASFGDRGGSPEHFPRRGPGRGDEVLGFGEALTAGLANQQMLFEPVEFGTVQAAKNELLKVILTWMPADMALECQYGFTIPHHLLLAQPAKGITRAAS